MPIPLLLHGKHADSAVTYQPFGPWIVPWQFQSFEEEYQTLRTGIGLIDYSTQAMIEVQGADRLSFLHNLLSNDIKRLAPGQGCQAALLTANGKLIATLLVLADPSSVWLLGDVTVADTVAQTLERYHFSEEVAVINHERRNAVFALQGPRAMEGLTRACNTVVSLPDAGDHLILPLERRPVRLIRHTLTGEVGGLVVVDAQHAVAAWELLRRNGAGIRLQVVGWDALNTARIEAGIPWWGLDMDETILLPETGLQARLASDTKGCYVGQEIVARLQTYGSASKKLMGLRIEGDRVPEAGDRIVRGDEMCGWITSACASPRLTQPLAMGYVKRGAYEPDTRVEIVRNGSRLPARTTTLASSG